MKEIIFATLIGITVLTLMVVVGFIIDRSIICPSFGKEVNLESKYSFFGGGCFVNYEGQWIKKESLRGGKLD